MSSSFLLGTHWKIDEQNRERAEARTHILILAAMHPELKLTDEAQEFVTQVKTKAGGKFWNQLASPYRKLEDGWDARIRLIEDPEQLQAEMDSLTQRFAEEEETSILEQYAFVPANPEPVAYLTSNLRYTGWLHLIDNMWFLWLAWLYFGRQLGP